MSYILTDDQIATLRSRYAELGGESVPLSFSDGMGVDSTALLVAFVDAGIVPSAILFADTGNEKDATYHYSKVQTKFLAKHSFPPVTVCQLKTLDHTPYDSLGGNCIDNETLPSLAFGGHSCAVKWKIVPQDQLIQGVNGPANKHPGLPEFLAAWGDGTYRKTGEMVKCEKSKKWPTGEKPVWAWDAGTGTNPIKIIGYDNGEADLRRTGRVHGKMHEVLIGAKPAFRPYEFWYPLQDLGWTRADCIRAIQAAGLAVPVKSSCYFCPASKPWELWWLAAAEPHNLIDALELEYGALTGKHSRWDEVNWGAWESHLATGKDFPSKKHCGLGRSFSWCKWAYDNKVVDLETMTVIVSPEFAHAKSDELRSHDNAADVRGCSAMEDLVDDAVQSPGKLIPQVIEIISAAPRAPRESRPTLHLKKVDPRLDPNQRATRRI